MILEPQNSPQWVILGIYHSPGRVKLLATKDVRKAEMSSDVEHQQATLTRMLPISWDLKLEISVNNLVMVEGATYQEALDNLLSCWESDQ